VEANRRGRHGPRGGPVPASAAAWPGRRRRRGPRRGRDAAHGRHRGARGRRSSEHRSRGRARRQEKANSRRRGVALGTDAGTRPGFGRPGRDAERSGAPVDPGAELPMAATGLAGTASGEAVTPGRANPAHGHRAERAGPNASAPEARERDRGFGDRPPRETRASEGDSPASWPWGSAPRVRWPVPPADRPRASPAAWPGLRADWLRRPTAGAHRRRRERVPTARSWPATRPDPVAVPPAEAPGRISGLVDVARRAPDSAVVPRADPARVSPGRAAGASSEPGSPTDRRATPERTRVSSGLAAGALRAPGSVAAPPAAGRGRVPASCRGFERTGFGDRPPGAPAKGKAGFDRAVEAHPRRIRCVPPAEARGDFRPRGRGAPRAGFGSRSSRGPGEGESRPRGGGFERTASAPDRRAEPTRGDRVPTARSWPATRRVRWPPFPRRPGGDFRPRGRGAPRAGFGGRSFPGPGEGDSGRVGAAFGGRPAGGTDAAESGFRPRGRGPPRGESGPRPPRAPGARTGRFPPRGRGARGRIPPAWSRRRRATRRASGRRELRSQVHPALGAIPVARAASAHCPAVVVQDDPAPAPVVEVEVGGVAGAAERAPPSPG
jgi:hypothetical protein